MTEEAKLRVVTPFRVELNDEADFAYWCERLGVDRELLACAVRSVGNGLEAVTHYLNARN